MKTSRISSKGQITIPKEIRKSLDVEPGDIIAYEVENGTVILRRVTPFDAVFHSALSSTLDEWGTSEDEAAFGDL